ncbi:hypothetical protein ACQEVB_15810 [Pseudonocardia sp. CA-107938]|uniref:hypothetical protein n=1 Tax=Pseudonocardia sp. CA-107938 TaxID=3240021 RepID=UPI003D8E79DE
MRPSITCPAVWPVSWGPLSFVVDSAGSPLYMVELAADRRLMTSVAGRSPDNYFYGGEEENVFATGPHWTVPGRVWARLSGLRLVYYRVVAFDHTLTVSAPSVTDDRLDAVPIVCFAADLPDLSDVRR